MSDILQHWLENFRLDRELEPNSAAGVFGSLIEEQNEDVLISFLSAWNKKGITDDEIFSLASIMRSRMKTITSKHQTFIDAVGTGGSVAKTFNVSTAAAFVIAGADVPVAKHGNRAASSKTGSADVLSELGVRVDVEPQTAEHCLNEYGICFMFAPKFHSLSSALASARRRFGQPTIFNCLGPLCNPAAAPHQLIGVWDGEIALSVANALSRLGTKKSWVVHASDGMDEISLAGSTKVFEVQSGSVSEFKFSPREFGIEVAANPAVPKARTSMESAEIVRGILDSESENQPSENLVAINAAAGIYLTGNADSPAEAFKIASESIRSGKAAAKLSLLGEATNR